MKHLLKGIVIGVIFSLCTISYSCSSSQDDDIIIPPDPTIKLKANKTEIIPFEDIKISINVDLEVLYDNYDSITWKANGTAYGSFMMLGHPWSNIDDERDIRITDYQIGKYKAYALGYKEGIIISIDSIEYEVVKPYKSFISIDWQDNKQNTYLNYTTGCTPYQYLPSFPNEIKFGGVDLQLSHIVENVEKQYAKLQLVPWSFSSNFKSSGNKDIDIPNINDFDWHNETSEGRAARYRMDYSFHHNYLTELYGTSDFIYEGADITKNTLEEEFAKRFTYRYSNDFYPVEIWDTPTSYICITQANNYAGGANQRGVCMVIAQPRH